MDQKHRSTLAHFHQLTPVRGTSIPQWRAKEQGSDRPVVLLHLNPKGGASPKQSAWIAIARRLMVLQPEGIQPVLDVCEDPEGPGTFVALAPMKGQPLSELLAQRETHNPIAMSQRIARLAHCLEQARNAVDGTWCPERLAVTDLWLDHGQLKVSLERSLGIQEPGMAALNTFALGRLLLGTTLLPEAHRWSPADVQPRLSPWVYERGPDGLKDSTQGLWPVGRQAVGGNAEELTPTPGDLQADLQLWLFNQQERPDFNDELAQARAYLQDRNTIALGAFLCAHPHLLLDETVRDYASQHLGDQPLRRLMAAEHLTGPEQFLVTWLHAPPNSTLPKQRHIWQGERAWYQRAMAQTIAAFSNAEQTQRMILIGVFPYVLPAWWSDITIEPLPDTITNEDTLRHLVRARLGSDTGGPNRWREALVTWVRGYARFDGFPIYIGHCLMSGTQYREAARVFSALYHYAGTQRDVEWSLCYLAYSSGRAWHEAGLLELAHFWLHRARIFTLARNDATRYYARTADNLMHKDKG